MRRTPAACWALLAVLSACATALSAQAANVLVVTEPEQFVYAIRNATRPGVCDQDTTLLLGPNGLSLQNLSVTPLQPTGSSQGSLCQGSLLIKPQVPNTTVLFDTAMRSGVVSLPRGFRLFLQDTIAINLCEAEFLQLDVRYLRAFTGTQLAILPRSPDVLSHNFTRVTMYLSQADLAQVMYLDSMVASTPFPQVLRQLAPVLDFNTKLGAELNVAYTLPYSLLIHHTRTAQTVADDLLCKSIALVCVMLLQSTDDPDDPLLKSLQAAGRLMPPQFCNGTLIPAGPLPEVNPAVPIWVVNATQTFVMALFRAWRLACIPLASWHAPPAVLLSGTASITAPGPLSTTTLPPLNDSLVLLGASNNDPAYAVSSVIDFAGQQAWLPLSSTAQLFIHDLTLTGLASQPLPSLQDSTQQAAAPTISSALPLAIFNFTELSLLTSPVVWMHNVTLQLPVDDYQALAALAAYGNNPSCQDPAISARAAQLQQGITSLSLGSMTAAPNTVLLNSFVGWGLNAKLLSITPMQPVSIPSCTAASSAGSDSSKMSKGQVVAAAVVGSVGGLLLLLAGVAGLRLLKRGQAYKSGKAAADSSVAHGAPCSMLHQIVNQAHEAQMQDMSMHLSDQCQAKVLEGCTSDQGQIASNGSEPIAAHNPCASPHAKTTVQSDTGAQPGKHAANVVPSSGASSRQTRSADLPKMMVKELAAQLNNTADQVHIMEKLGQGSSGAVFKGVWRGLPVALKTLVFESSPQEDAASSATGSHSTSAAGGSGASHKQPRAIMEAAIAASLGHRNVVCTYKYDIKAIQAKDDLELGAGGGQGLQVIDLNDEPEQQSSAYKLFLVQELCNMSLERVFRKGGFLLSDTSKVDYEVVTNVLLDIAQGLAYLHDAGVIHGDLKPDNVLLKVDESVQLGVVAKLADFGLSMHLGHAATHISNWAAGTPFYVAPEVVMQRRVSMASDVFSFGVLMWQLCTNQAPYKALGAGQFAWNPNFPRFSGPNLPSRAYQSLIAKCLQAEPKQRPTAMQLVRALSVLVQTGASL